MTDTVQVPREATEEKWTCKCCGFVATSPESLVWHIEICKERMAIAAAPQATDPRDAEIERLKGELILAKASAEAAGSLLLDVQKDCIAERQGRLAAEARLATLTAERDALRAALERLLLKFDFLVEKGVLPDVRDDIIFVDARAALITQPSKTETRDGG